MIYVILGQTASGKTSLALRLARAYSLPIVSADAYQCFKMMQIGTDKPTREETQGIPYYFYDCYEPDVDMDVYTFQKTMRPILDSYEKEGKDVLVVGGTFLYVKALLYPYEFVENVPSATDYDSLSLTQLQELLKTKDPASYERIDIKNKRRVISALRIFESGKSRIDIEANNSQVPLYPLRFYQIAIDKEMGNQKIDQRVDKMFEEGILDEVYHLADRYGEDCRSFLAIGYKEILQGRREGKSPDEMKELIKIHTHQYAKKQRTFLSHQFKDVLIGDASQVYQWIKDELEKKKD